MSSWKQVFQFVVDLSGKKDHEMLWEVWNSKMIQEGFGEFKSKIMGDTQNTDSGDSESIWASPEKMEEIIKNSEWDFYSLDELEI